MTIQRARSAQEYADWVKQAKFEIQDLRECLHYDAEELGGMSSIPVFLDPLERLIDELFQVMSRGEYHFARDDLPFVEIVDRHADQIPFYVLLRQINETHRYGLDVEES